jgi:hypothetical protein
MAKLPDRKAWDYRTKSYMYYPGIPSVQIDVGASYLIAYIDMENPRLWHTVIRADTFKTVGRRWTIRWNAPEGRVGTCAFLYESEVLDQLGHKIVVGMPWKNVAFNPHHSDRNIRVA